MKKLNPLCRFLCCCLLIYITFPMAVSAQLIISPPTFPTSNTIRLTLTGAQSTNAHIIFSSPDLIPDIASWNRMITGTVGQVTFTISKPTNDTAFFMAGIAPIGTPTAATPIFDPDGGSYAGPTNVTIMSATDGASIYYTTNGSTPTTSDFFLFNGDSVFLSGITTLKAIAVKAGYNDSAVATGTYNINTGPFVSAGPQQIITTSPTTLEGVVTDDGLTGAGSKFTNWVEISGPGTVTFGNSHQTNSTASFSVDGIYVLQLSASDGQYTNSSQVTIALNPTISVSMAAPSDGSTYTVPTNILLQATASCSSGSVTQVLFYANSTLIGAADTTSGNTFSLQWKNVSSGSLALKAVAQTDDTNNLSLASDPVNVTVNWPTNVGQVTLAQTDLQIPSAGFSIAVNRQYNTLFGTNGSFGNNGRLDYEAIKITKSGSLATGWLGTSGGISYSIQPTVQHLITVSLSDSSQYYFVAQLVFDQSGSATVNSSVTPDGYNGFTVHLVCTPLGQGQMSVAAPNDGNDDTVGMDDQLSGWNQSLPAAWFDDTLFPTGQNYDPDFSQFTFTAPDGTKYTFNGDGTVASKTDRNNNTLFYSFSGISSSTGRQVSFTRDGNNRITEINDPIAINTSGSPAVKYAYDSIGNLTNVARLTQRSSAIYDNTSYAYTNTTFPNSITAITDPRGIVSQRYEYDSEGRIHKQYDAFSRAITYTYDTTNHEQTVIDRNDSFTTQTFTPSGQLASEENVDGVTSYGYDSQGNETSQTNQLGEVTSFAYDENNYLTGITNEISVVANTTYNDFGQPLVNIDAMGFGTTNSYDDNGNLSFTTNALSVVTAYGYDSQGNRLAQTNALGLAEQVVIQNEYDQYGDLTNTTTLDANYQLVSSTGYTYDDNGNKLTETKTRTLPNGGDGSIFTQWGYDAANRIVQTIDADGFTNSVVYNGIGKEADTVDALGRTNQFFYDAAGMLTNETFADTTFETYAYDANGNRTNFVDRANHSVSYEFDDLGHLEQTTYDDGSASGAEYDAAGRVISESIMSVPTGGGMSPPSFSTITVSRYAYDAANRRTALTNALNQVTQYTYDNNGNQTKVIDAINNTNTYLYDPLNRQIERIYPNNTTEYYGYNALGNRIAVTNQDNIISCYGYDALGRLVAVTNAFATSQQMVTRYVYDEVGNLLQQIDSLNRTNKFACDGLGHRTKQVLPGNQVAMSGYDAVGNVIRYTNFNNVVITNQYDALNRLTNKTSINGYHVSFAYSPIGERTNMTDASGITSYTYDLRDRLQNKITPEGTLTYSYDGFGNLFQITTSTTNGTQLTYLYDSLNRITNVVDRFTNSTAYGYDPVGNLQTVLLPNSVTNTYIYDSLNRLTNLTATSGSGVLAKFAYKLDAAGNRTNLVEAVNGINRTNAWSYDPLFRLTNETITATGGGSISYKYDSAGNRTNRTSSVSGIATVNATFNNNDQLQTDNYDSNGNTTNSAAKTYSYDVDNHLTNYNGGTAIYVCDGDGNRVKGTVSGVSVYYLVDDRNPSGFTQVLEELTTVGSTPSRLYSYGLDLISQRQSGGTTSFYGYDGNGNTRFLTATNATISDAYAYDAFGTLISSTGTTPNNYLYTGEQYDPNLGFYYLRARYMNPATGRFWTRDSFEGRDQDPQSLHKYLYVKNQPVNLADPSGNDFGLLNIDISINLSEIISFATVTVQEVSKSVGTALEFSPKNTTLGMVQRLLAAEVREPGNPAFDLNDSESGLFGVGAVIVNRVLSPKFPNTIEGVIKQHNQFAGFESYPTLSTSIENTIAGLQQNANAKGSKVLKYKLHMINLLYIANRVVNLDDQLDIFVPAGGPYIPTLFFRKAGSSNPWGGPARKLPEYRTTVGGNDFYTDRQ